MWCCKIGYYVAEENWMLLTGYFGFKKTSSLKIVLIRSYISAPCPPVAITFPRKTFLIEIYFYRDIIFRRQVGLVRSEVYRL